MTWGDLSVQAGQYVGVARRLLEELDRHQCLENRIARVRIESPEALDLGLGQAEAWHLHVFGLDDSKPIVGSALVGSHRPFLYWLFKPAMVQNRASAVPPREVRRSPRNPRQTAPSRGIFRALGEKPAAFSAGNPARPLVWMHVLGQIGIAVGCLSLAVPYGFGQEAPQPQRVEIPANATSLEGIPTVRIDSAEGMASRRSLDAAEAAKAGLTVRVVDGQFYWTTRGDRLLHLNTSGG